MVTAARAASPIDVTEFRGRELSGLLGLMVSALPANSPFPGLTVVAVNLDQRRLDADRFLAKLHPTFNVRESRRNHLLAAGFIAMASPCEVLCRE